MSKQYKTFYYHNARDIPGEYFPMPKSIFRLGLTAGELLVYTYLMYCEDRKTFQCHPSYATIGEAVNMSNNTVAKHVEGLVRKHGTGCVTMINDHLYEGRFSPRVNGKRIARNIYATTREECEENLKTLIAEMKKEIAEIKSNAKNEG